MHKVGSLGAALGLLVLALSGCAGSDPEGSGTTTGPAASRTTTSRFMPPTTTTGGSTVTVTHTETVTTGPSPTSTTPAPPATTTTNGGGGGGTPVPADHAPIVNSTRVTAVSEVSATVAWNVSDESGAVKSHVEYGIGTGNFSVLSPERIGLGDQSLTLTGLRSCTTYGFRVVAIDPGGHRGAGFASNPTFRTTGSQPSVSNVTFPTVMHTSLTLSWRITGPADTTSQVEYGTTTAYGSLSPTVAGAGVRTVTLQGLVQNTDYNFRIKVTSPCGNVQTGNLVQRTAQLIHVDIEGNLGSTGSFNKGSTLYGTLDLVANRHYVFEVRNDDTSTHTFQLTGGPSYSSGNIPSGQTYTFPASVVFAAGDYGMRCGLHTSMQGTIDVT